MARTKPSFSFLDHLTFVDDDSSNYEIGIHDGGFSYLDMVSEKRAKRISFEERQERQTKTALDGSTRAYGKSNITKVEEADHDSVCFDTDLRLIIQDIQQRRKRVAIFPTALGVAVALGVALGAYLHWLSFTFLSSLILVLLFVAIAFLVLLNVWRLDVSRRHARISYSFSGRGGQAFSAISEALCKFASSEQVLSLCGRKHYEDTRYSGGAESLPVFAEARLDHKKPPLVEVDVDVWHIRMPHRDIYFMPDHLLVFDGANIGGIGYAHVDLSTALETSQARDIAKRTRDCKVVGNTWRFVNNDGTPDKRFNSNIQVPLVEYGILSVSGRGLDVRFYTSLQDASVSAPAGFTKMKELASKPVLAAAESRKTGFAERKAKAQSDVYVILMDALCCVMVADGAMTRAEKDKVHALMRRARAPWSGSRVDAHIQNFIGDVRRTGFSAVLDLVCQNLASVTSPSTRKAILDCVSSMARSDGAVGAAERRVCARLASALGGGS